MSKKVIAAVIVMLMSMLFLASCEKRDVKAISEADLRDKIAGGWAGKMIGVTYGAPTEFMAMGKTYDAEIKWDPASVIDSIAQDDMFGPMKLMETLEQYGLDANAEQFQEVFAEGAYCCHANKRGLKNYWEGIKPPMSGSPEYTMHADDIDFQIEADFIGFMHPGMPQSSNEMCDKVGHVMCHGDGVYGGMFVCALYTEAFFSSDVESVLLKALESLPKESQYAQCVQDVVDGYRKYPDDWKKTWQIIEDKWADVDICVPEDPQGFNIDAKFNGAYIAMGLLYGEGDFAKTMEISTRCGQDSDCNPSNAAAVIGVINGYSAIPDEWKSGIPAMGDTKFQNCRYSFNTAVDKTLDFAKQLVVRNGGKVVGDTIYVKIQKPAAPVLEQSYPNLKFKYQVVFDEKKDWSLTGNWVHEVDNLGDPRVYTDEKGAECIFAFNGTGVVITGKMAPDCGKADVYLDGEYHKTVDCYFPGTYDGSWTNAFHVYHAINLAPGEHVVKIVPNGEKLERATGTRVYVEKAIVFETK